MAMTGGYGRQQQHLLHSFVNLQSNLTITLEKISEPLVMFVPVGAALGLVDR